MTAEPHARLAPYALGALDPAERELCEAHLAGCRRCRTELVDLQAAADRLDQAKLSLRAVDDVTD